MGLIALVGFVVASALIYLLALPKVFYVLAALWSYTGKFFLELVFGMPMGLESFYKIHVVASSKNRETRLCIVLLFFMLSLAASWLVYDHM
jgi:hypothetical protein